MSNSGKFKGRKVANDSVDSNEGRQWLSPQDYTNASPGRGSGLLALDSFHKNALRQGWKRLILFADNHIL